LRFSEIEVQHLSVCFCKVEGWPDQPVDLPLPKSDLVDWLLLDVEFRTLAFTSLLKSNPSVLLLALSRFFDSVLRAPHSVDELTEFCRDTSFSFNPCGHVYRSSYLVDREPSEALPALSPKLIECVDQFLESGSNKKTRKSLTSFLSRVAKDFLPKASRPSKESTQQLVDKLVGTALSTASFKLGRTDKWSRKACRQRWGSNQPVNGEQNLLLDLLCQRLQNQDEFNKRLQIEKLASMKGLAYGASHEINNPLANIATRAQALLAEETHPDKRHRLAVIYEQAMRAHEMISDMMLFAHPPALSREMTDLRLLVARVANEVRPSLEHHKIKLFTRIDMKIDRVDIDPTQLSVLLSSLLRNSRESILHDHGEIELRIRLSRSFGCKMIRITVTDNGAGVDDSVRPYLFDPFYSSREAGRGLGFGLSKAWRIAELHGGRVFLESSQPNVATTFVVELPIN
jgi:signal transduction histidine kinase